MALGWYIIYGCSPYVSGCNYRGEHFSVHQQLQHNQQHSPGTKTSTKFVNVYT